MKTKMLRTALLFVFTVALVLLGNPLGIGESKVITTFAADIPDLKPGPLPDRVDLSEDVYFPPIGDQGGLGSCSSWATTYYQYTYAVAAKLYPNNQSTPDTDFDQVFSPKWTYNYINGGIGYNPPTVGIEENYRVLRELGAARQSEFPYVGDISNPANYREWSNDNAVKMRALSTRLSASHRGSYGSYQSLTDVTPITGNKDQSLDEMKSLLNSQYILVVTTDDFDGWFSPNGLDVPDIVNNEGKYEEVITKLIDDPSDDPSGHAVSIVGYDDSIEYDLNHNGMIEDFERGAFKVANSHGDYANDGFVWVMYDALNKKSNVNTDEYNSVGRREIFGRYNYYWIEVEKYDLDSRLEITLNSAQKNDVVIWINSDYSGSFFDGIGGSFSFDGQYDAEQNKSQSHTFIFDVSNKNVPLSVEIRDMLNSAYSVTVENIKFFRGGELINEYNPNMILNGTSYVFSEDKIASKFDEAERIYLYNTPETFYIQGVSKSQEKYYYFEPSLAGIYTFYSTENAGDPCAWLYDANRSPMGDAYDDGNLNRNFKISCELDQGQGVYILAGSSDTEEAFYKLSVNSPDGILSLNETTTIELKRARPQGSLQKEYEFTAPSTGSYVFRASYSATLPRISVFSSLDMDSLTIKPGTEIITRNLLKGETIIIAAGFGAVGIDASFTLTVTRNDHFTTAYPMTLNEYISGEILQDPGSGPGNNVYYYKFTPEQSGLYQCSGVGYTTPLVFTVYDADQKQYGDATNSRWTTIVNYDHHFARYMQAGKDYYIVVSRGSSGPGRSYGGYNLKLTTADYQNNSFDSAYYVPFDTSLRSETREGENNTRYYRFTPTESGYYRCEGYGYMTPLAFRLYDQNRSLLKDTKQNEVNYSRWTTVVNYDHYITYYMEKGKSYYLEISRGSSNSGRNGYGMYSFEMFLLENTSFGTATKVTNSGARLELAMPQIRYFAFTPSEAGSYTFAGSDYTNMPSLQIYDAAEKLIVENKEAGESFVRAMLLADQTYYLAAGFFGDEIGGYDISIVYSPNEPWAAETAYAAGKIITFGTDANGEPVRYIVLQAHTSASHWFPSSTPSLYKQLEVPRWTQPFGVTDAYNAGDKVEYNGVLWISDINANVWSPGVAGWSVYNGPL